ncbi:MAG TPA: farnesyl diphosphate synthase [Gemmatimonadaceae bacterium]
MSDAFAVDRGQIERRLGEICTADLKALDRKLADAVQYALKSPGKRIRPLLLQYAYRAAGGDGDASMLACAPEVIHSYSLVHDDLPCMDDDDMRRGRPTLHRVYGTRIAILAGAVMIPLSVKVAVSGLRALDAPAPVAREVVEALLEGAGAGGMIGGQLRDLSGEGLSLSMEQREGIHVAKTGALIVASVRMGALAAGADAASTDALTRYAEGIGLAFQIMDDVLDVTSTTSALGKTTGRDVALGKSTYPALLGVDGARARALTLIDQALETLAAHQLLTQELSQVANFMVTRTS